MGLSIEVINSQSPYLDEVINLGDKYSKFLGFLPKKAFNYAARNGQIIVAILDGKCVGYLLFRIVKTKNRLSITHLCVEENFRSKNIGRKLVEFLITKSSPWNGISLYCRRDYASNKFWSHMGFKYLNEKKGRGKDNADLTFFYYDNNQPTLFTLANEELLKSKPFSAVIDMNVFISLFEDKQNPLLADWLSEYLLLCVTPEIRAEINRDENKTRRLQMLNYLDKFPEINAKTFGLDEEKAYRLFCSFQPPITEQDESDLRQISWAVASKTNFFITKDKNLSKRLSSILFSDFGISIVSDEEMIVQFDEKVNNASYQENRLEGSSLQISKITYDQIKLIIDIFHKTNREKKGAFANKLQAYLSFPTKNETYVVTSNKNPIALIVHALHESSLDIPLIRVNSTPLSPDLESQVVFWSIKRAVEQGKQIITVTDQNISSNVTQALSDNSFSNQNGIWGKINLIGIETLESTREKIQEIINANPSFSPLFHIEVNRLSNTDLLSDPMQIISVEKSFWPLKISCTSIQNYLIPIQARWAIDLFDYDLGGQTLFGSKTELVIKMENVYYRSSHTKIPHPQSRVLWYVSSGKEKYLRDIKAIRACSYVENVLIGTPKEIFKKYKELGVFNWRKVLLTANEKIDGEVLAFRFSRTEIFKHPISLQNYMLISGNKCAPQSSQSISNNLFEEIYKKGLCG